MRRLPFILLVVLGIFPALYFTGCKGGNFAPQPYYGYITNTPTGTFTITSTPLPGSPTLTPTPSPTPPPFVGDTFNSQSVVSNWVLNTTQPSGLPVSIIYNSTFSGCAASTGAMEVTVGFNAVTQGVFLQHDLTSPVNLGGKSVTLILDVTGGWNSDSAQLYGAVFVGQGSTAGPNGGLAYSSLYQSGTGLYFASTSTPSSSGCVTLTLPIPSGVTATDSYSGYSVYNGPFDSSQVEILGIQIGTGGSGSGFANTIIDIQSWL